MDIDDFVQYWVGVVLGSHFYYGQTGQYHYIRCRCPGFEAGIVRIEDQRFYVIGQIKSIHYLEQENVLGYTKKDDTACVEMADPTSFDKVENLIHESHELGKKAWKEYHDRKPKKL